MTDADKPLVTVVVPVYNVENYLDDCLESIRQQTYDNLEILVVEDCSTDGSLKILESHLSDPRVLLIQQPHNAGLSAARNAGIGAAGGEYIMFVDSDDIIDFRLIEACVSCSRKDDAQVVTYCFSPFNDGGATKTVRFDSLDETRRLGDDYFRLPHFAWLKFLKLSILRDEALRFPLGLYYEDWPFHWSLGLAAKNIRQLDAKLYHYRQRGASITGSAGPKLLDLFSVQRLVMEAVSNSENASSELRRALGSKLRDSHWSVLTRIDETLLSQAYDKAKEADRIMQLNGLVSESNLKRFLIKLVVQFPKYLGIPTLWALRKTLKTISPARKRLVKSSVTT